MLYYHRQGEGPEVVLVHGFLGSSKIFEPLTNHLVQRFSVTTIDLPGFGNSVDIPVPSTVGDLSELVVDTVQSAGVRQFSVLGHSLGAWIALELSLQHSELLEKIVIYGGSPDGHCPDRFETYEKSIARIRAEGIESFAAELAGKWFRRGVEDPMYALAREAGKNADEKSSISHIKSWNSWRTRDRLGQIITPTLIVCGDNDRSTHPSLSFEMWEKIKPSHLFIVPNAGHIAHLEQTNEFNSLVGKFLEQKWNLSDLNRSGLFGFNKH